MTKIADIKPYLPILPLSKKDAAKQFENTGLSIYVDLAPNRDGARDLNTISNSSSDITTGLAPNKTGGPIALLNDYSSTFEHLPVDVQKLITQLIPQEKKSFLGSIFGSNPHKVVFSSMDEATRHAQATLLALNGLATNYQDRMSNIPFVPEVTEQLKFRMGYLRPWSQCLDTRGLTTAQLPEILTKHGLTIASTDRRNLLGN